jgi:hypothetical protein
VTLVAITSGVLTGCTDRRAEAQLAEVSRKANSLAVVIRQRDDSAAGMERKRVADSIQAERTRPRVLTLLNQRKQVAPNNFVRVGFVLPSAGDCAVSGRVAVESGGGKDVAVFVFRDDDFTNWANNAASTAATFHAGPQSVTSLDVPVREAGRYWFVVSNRFSLLTWKQYDGDVSVRCIGEPMPELTTEPS